MSDKNKSAICKCGKTYIIGYYDQGKCPKCLSEETDVGGELSGVCKTLDKLSDVLAHREQDHLCNLVVDLLESAQLVEKWSKNYRDRCISFDCYVSGSKEDSMRWESFCDKCYFGLWAVREIGEKRWGHCFHVQTNAEAEGLRDLLNELSQKHKSCKRRTD